MKKEPEFLVFDLVWHKAIQELPAYERLEMYEAIFSYALSGRIPENITGTNRSVLMVICDRIPTDIDEDSCPEDHKEPDTDM